MSNKLIVSTAILIFSISSLCSKAAVDFEPKMGVGVITNSTLDGVSIKILPFPRLILQLGGYYRYREGEPVYDHWGIGDEETAVDSSEIRELEKDWEAGLRVFWRAHRLELGEIWVYR